MHGVPSPHRTPPRGDQRTVLDDERDRVHAVRESGGIQPRLHARIAPSHVLRMACQVQQSPEHDTSTTLTVNLL